LEVRFVKKRFCHVAKVPIIHKKNLAKFFLHTSYLPILISLFDEISLAKKGFVQHNPSPL
jgi:hypothetical protein